MNQHHHALAIALKETAGAEDVMTGTLPPSAFRKAVDAWINGGEEASHMPSATLLLVRIDRDERPARNDAAAELRTVAELAAPCIRSTDVVGRVDADTVGILLPSTPTLQAERTSLRLRAEVGARTAHAGRPLTVSIGLASTFLDDPWRSAADAVTLAHLQGGDRTVIASPDPAGGVRHAH